MQTSESLGRDALRLLVWYPVRWLLLALPAKAGMTVLTTMGDIHFFLAPGKRKQLATNLQRSDLPDARDPEKREKIIRRYLQTHYLDQLLPLVLPKLTPQNIEQFVHFSGVDTLDAALKKKKGVILVHGHFGPAHLPLAALALRGYPMKQIGNPSDKGLSWIGRNVAFRLRMIYEGRMPAEIIKADRFLRPVFRALQQNKVIMTTGDGSGKEEHFGKQYLSRFLGQPVSLPLGPAILAKKTGAPLLPLFIVPGEGPPFTVIIGQEIVSSLPGEQGIIDCANQFAALLEDLVRRHPYYMHFLDRFSPGQFITDATSPPSEGTMRQQ